MKQRSGAWTDAAILRHFEALPGGRSAFKHLVRELGVKGEERQHLETALERLAERGDLIETKSGHYVLASRSRDFAAGRLNVHRDGYAFLIPDHPIEWLKGDVYVPASEAARAMHGDRVLVRIRRIEAGGRADGEIVKILGRAHQTVVGEFLVKRRGNFVKPHDERIPHWIEIPEGMERPAGAPNVDRIGVGERAIGGADEMDGMVVNVEILEFPEGGENAVGRVIEILGFPDDFGVDVEIIIRKHHIPHRFPAEVLEQAQAIPSTIRSDEAGRRRDFRGMDIVTIDGETARDFDDAVWVDRLPNGNFKLDVHIADVSHYVRPGSAIDGEAFLRGTSVYFPDRAVPMLPLELSTEICSLKPQVDRLVMSCLMEIDHRGDVVSQEFVRGVIRSVERMTYTNVHLVLEGDAGQRERYQHLIGRFELMRELALILNRKRVKRGSIDFDLPEALITFDDAGAMTGVLRHPRNIAHRLIEEFMLAANESVAAALESAEVPSVYRIHEPPEAKRVMEFEELAAHFGYTLGVGPIPVKRFSLVDRKGDGRKVRRDLTLNDELRITSRHYQKLVAQIEGKPEERILSYLMLRSLRQARYSERNSGHFALAASSYTHFTSPIRRYPDLMVHRALGARIDEAPPRWTEDELHAMAEECSRTERRAADAERELVEWKKAKFMIDRVGEEFDGLIISTAKYGFWVELRDLFIEGFVPIDTLPGERFLYHENTRKIVGERSRKQFSIGDAVRVILDRVDEMEKKLQFSVVVPESGRRRRRPER
ncbi:MAG TPA: ribonuclease R [Solibacterales bacterium]|nr:ribonuclease R [Bryobacterales bacterium]